MGNLLTKVKDKDAVKLLEAAQDAEIEYFLKAFEQVEIDNPFFNKLYAQHIGLSPNQRMRKRIKEENKKEESDDDESATLVPEPIK